MILSLELNSQENWGTFLGFQPTWQKELEDSVGGSPDSLPEGKRARRLAWTTGEHPDQGRWDRRKREGGSSSG